MEDITDADYTYRKKFVKILGKYLGEYSRKYHDLYVQSDTLLLADVFENFRNLFLEIYELDPDRFLAVPGLAWQAALKKVKAKLHLLTDKAKLHLLTDIYMLLMVENVTEVEYVTLFIDMQKLIANT